MNYPQAKLYGKYALILIIFDIIITMFLALLMIGLIVGSICADINNFYNYYVRSYGELGGISKLYLVYRYT